MTKQVEGRAVLVVQGNNYLEDNTFHKYMRIGHMDEDRLCDRLSRYCFDKLSGDILPPRWRYNGPEKFIERFGGGFKWSITKSYHGLFLNGQYVLRMWTNAYTPYVWVDIPGHFLHPLSLNMEVIDIPEGSLHKCRPMSLRAKVTEESQIDLLIVAIKSMYGLDG